MNDSVSTQPPADEKPEASNSKTSSVKGSSVESVLLHKTDFTAAELDFLVLETKEWQSYEGPEGGSGWQNTETGEVVYQDEKPEDEVAQDPEDMTDEELAEVLASQVGEDEATEYIENDDREGAEERLRDEMDGGEADPHAADGSESRDDVENHLEDIGEEYSDPEVGDTVYGVDLEMPEKEWMSVQGEVTEVHGDKIDVQYENGDSKSYARPEDFYEVGGEESTEEPEEEDSGDELDTEALENVDPDDTESVVDAIGVDYTDRTEFRELSDDQQYKLKEGLEEVYGEQEIGQLYDRIDEWKEWSDGDAGHFLESGFGQTEDGLWGESFRDGDADPSQEQIQAMEVMRQTSQDFVSEEYGDEVTVHRGISSEAWDQWDGGDDEWMEMSSMAVMTHQEDVAESFADDNGSAVVTMDVPTEEVVFAMDGVTDAVTGGGREGEIQIIGGERQPDVVTPA